MTKALGRRQILAGIATAISQRAWAGDTHAPRRQVLSLSLQSSGTRVLSVDQMTTFGVTLPLEANARALRVGIANIAPAPFSLSGVCCCEGRGSNPAPGAEWAYLTFTGDGTKHEPVATPQQCIIPGNRQFATGAVNVPMIYWSDWVQYRTNAPSGRPQMLFRVLVPPQQLSMTVVAGQGDFGEMIPGLRPWLLELGQIPGDFVTDPRRASHGMHKSRAVPLMVVQYESVVPGAQIVIGGDSQLVQWHTFGRQAAIALSTPALPVSVWDTAWGGQPSNTFWPCLDAGIDLGRPSVCLIQGWTGNDGINPRSADGYEKRVQESAQRVLRQGGVPIIVKAMPRHLSDKPSLLNVWSRANRDLDTLVPGALLFDPCAYIMDPSRPGDWALDASDDGVHPNVNGSVRLRAPFESLLRNLL